jgi:hypothetical protein
MHSLGLASAEWPAAVGGPPPRQSPRPFRKVLDWLMGLMGKVWRILLACVDAIRSSLAALGISAVAINVSWPPGVGFELSTELISVADNWNNAARFFDEMAAEVRAEVFA